MKPMRCKKCSRCIHNTYRCFLDREELLFFFFQQFKDSPGVAGQKALLIQLRRGGMAHVYTCKHLNRPWPKRDAYGPGAALDCDSRIPVQIVNDSIRAYSCEMCQNNKTKVIHDLRELAAYFSGFSEHDGKIKALRAFKIDGKVRVYRCTKSSRKMYLNARVPHRNNCRSYDSCDG